MSAFSGFYVQSNPFRVLHLTPLHLSLDDLLLYHPGLHPSQKLFLFTTLLVNVSNIHGIGRKGQLAHLYFLLRFPSNKHLQHIISSAIGVIIILLRGVLGIL